MKILATDAKPLAKPIFVDTLREPAWLPEMVSQAGVVYTEPYPATGAYWSCPNLIMTQHTGGFAPQRQIRLMGLLAENVRRYISGLPLMNVVDKQRGYWSAKRFDFHKGEIHEFQTNAYPQRSLRDAVPDCRSGGTSATTGRRAGEALQYREAEINGWQEDFRRDRDFARPEHLLRHGQRRVRFHLDRDAAQPADI
ncbi:MAG: hypothetical protein WBL65_02580 [Bryobacteraceae bacterium]